jgi:hypothetical protein
VQLRELQRADEEDFRRDEQRESLSLDAVKSEMAKGGLVRLKDSAGKFEMILEILDQLLEAAERGSGHFGHQELFKALYGTTDANWFGERMLERFAEMNKSEANCQAVMAFLEKEYGSYRQARVRYPLEHRDQTAAAKEARLVICGGDALILFREIEVTDRLFDRKLRLLLTARAERAAREEKEGRGQEEEGNGQKAGGSSDNPNGNPGGDPEGSSAGIPPRKPVQSDDGQEAEVSQQEQERQKAKGKSEDHATSQHKPGGGPEAAKRRKSLAQGASPGLDGRPPSSLFRQPAKGSRQSAEGGQQQAAIGGQLGSDPGLEHAAGVISLKNKATDLLDNKASAAADGRNKATVESSKQAAEGGRQSTQVSSPLTSPRCGRQRGFLLKRTGVKVAETQQEVARAPSRLCENRFGFLHFRAPNRINGGE